MYKSHPLFSNCDDGALYLQFIMYYDDVELTNPLGSSRGKHKLGITNNISPCIETYYDTVFGFSSVLLYTGKF